MTSEEEYHINIQAEREVVSKQFVIGIHESEVPTSEVIQVFKRMIIGEEKSIIQVGRDMLNVLTGGLSYYTVGALFFLYGTVEQIHNTAWGTVEQIHNIAWSEITSKECEHIETVEGGELFGYHVNLTRKDVV